MNQGFNKNLIILLITPLMFISAGIALICAGSLDNMVAGIFMLMLAAWLYLFFIVAFEWLVCTVSLKGNELVCRKGINRAQHIALDGCASLWSRQSESESYARESFFG